ncbi:MAG: succinate dehydrogenase cytochrome b subunit [Saprospiraceae bacterium]|nr:succinate dehydrogenase cytochrome b subunit [Saprospiraceae bacterium]
MSWLSEFLVSSIGRKLVMGITGLFLITFLLVHCIVNACIFVNDGGALFNKAAHFMGSNPLIRTVEIVLFLGILLHIVQGLIIWSTNKSKRPINYSVYAGKETGKWYSRSMGLLGTLILLFLIVHLANFWVPSRFTGGFEEVTYDGVTYHNVFLMMKDCFSSPLIVLIYVVGVISLCYHLMHGFASAFQTLGINHPKYNSFIKSLGFVFSIVISVLFALMPISMHLGWVN